MAVGALARGFDIAHAVISHSRRCRARRTYRCVTAVGPDGCNISAGRVSAMRRRLGIAVALVLALSACSGNSDTDTDTVAHTPDPVRVVVIGSVPTDEPERSKPCPGCTAFWTQFARHVGSELRTETTLDAVSVGSVQEALKAVSGPGADADKVAAGDVVVVTVGALQALPDPETGIGCKAWFLEAKGPCLAEGVKTYGKI